MCEKERIFAAMINRLIVTLCMCISLGANGQYYYKDILTTQQTMELLKKYREQEVKNVKVVSYESTGDPTEDFAASQSISDNYTRIRTNLETALNGTSELTTYFNKNGQLVRTTDTTDGSGSVSEYTYNSQGQLTMIVNVSTSAGQQKEKEVHAWYYDKEGRPEKMHRIKNDVDTTYIELVLDEQGNVAEENSRRKGSAPTSYFYYYNNDKRLTDIVTYNQKAKRLLPVYIFEYNDNGSLRSMMIIPEGTDDYQKWLYEYNAGGLKTKETAYNKRRQMLGRMEYRYSE